MLQRVCEGLLPGKEMGRLNFIITGLKEITVPELLDAWQKPTQAKR